MASKHKTVWASIKSTVKPVTGAVGRMWRKVRSWRWYQRWPLYIVSFIVLFLIFNWVTDRLMPQIKNPIYGVSFSEKYSKELGLDWKANYSALLSDLGAKRLRLMSYWDLLEPQQGKYDFKDLDWQMSEAAKHNAKVSLAIGLRQPRWPECHEPGWAKKMAFESEPWRQSLYAFVKAVSDRYKNSPALESYQMENEAMNNFFGDCRAHAKRERLITEFNMLKKNDPKHPVWMALSEEHGFPIGQPTPDAYGFSIYRTVYSNNLPIHFYITYPTSDWFHRLRAAYLRQIRHRPVFIHELQLEPWGPVTTKKLSIKEQDRSMSVSKMYGNLVFGRKTGIQLEYLWGSEWWYWRKVHFQDDGPWNVVKQTLKRYPDIPNPLDIVK